jgi:hypothetical protein
LASLPWRWLCSHPRKHLSVRTGPISWRPDGASPARARTSSIMKSKVDALDEVEESGTWRLFICYIDDYQSFGC